VDQATKMKPKISLTSHRDMVSAFDRARDNHHEAELIY